KRSFQHLDEGQDWCPRFARKTALGYGLPTVPRPSTEGLPLGTSGDLRSVQGAGSGDPAPTRRPCPNERRDCCRVSAWGLCEQLTCQSKKSVPGPERPALSRVRSCPGR